MRDIPTNPGEPSIRRRILNAANKNAGTSLQDLSSNREAITTTSYALAHFTPTSGSWLNMVEVFVSIITRQAIRRGSFNSVKELMTATTAFIQGWNQRCQPFVWTKTADEILPHTRKPTSDARH